MIHKEQGSGCIGLSNGRFSLLFRHEGGLMLHSLRHACVPDNPETRGQPSAVMRSVFVLDVEGIRIPSEQMTVQAVETVSDAVSELVSVTLSVEVGKHGTIGMRLSLLGNPNDSMRLFLQMKADWNGGIPREVHVELPLFRTFLDVWPNSRVSFPANPWRKTDGTPLFKLHSDFVMPLGIFDETMRNGFSFQFPAQFPWWDNYNTKITRVSDRERLETLRFPVKPHNEIGDIMEMRIAAIQHGWTEYFADWRELMRQPYRFGEIRKPAYQWYKDTFLHHFTYVFGKEVFNYETQAMEVERLIAQGEAFGGYDAVILWHQYPRLGVDDRTQWQFFEDYPGGLEGLARDVAVLHQHGIKVFLPFKPWDVRQEENMKAVGLELAKLVAQTDVDGFFLDTMNSVPAIFREEIDKVKAGVVFCSEIQPHEQKNLELLTGSWDQYQGELLEMDINLLRFVFPENVQHTIARWSVGARKDKLIRRAVFNGTGIVIWQDVFGAWLPYDDAQKADIRKWKRMYKENQAAFLGANPIPFYPTLREGVYANCFPSDDGERVL